MTVAPASAAEMAEARTRFAVRLDAEDLQRETDGDIECIICLGEMEADEPLVCLPCNGKEEGEESAAKSHVFHADCLARWLLTSAQCPTCRRKVRPMLAKARGAARASACGTCR